MDKDELIIWKGRKDRNSLYKRDHICQVLETEIVSYIQRTASGSLGGGIGSQILWQER